MIGRAGNRDMDQANGSARIPDRLQQPLDEIAMHRAGVAAGPILQDTEAVDDHVDLAFAQQPRQRA